MSPTWQPECARRLVAIWTDEVVASLLETPEGLQLGGEKRKVTILMSDLRGFSALSERLPPETAMPLSISTWK
jgi:class 3 adenylate cyclase